MSQNMVVFQADAIFKFNGVGFILPLLQLIGQIER